MKFKSAGTEETILEISDEALSFLKSSLGSENKKAARLELIFGRDALGKGTVQYQLIAVEGPDLELDLGDDQSFIIDGSTLPLLRGTKIDLRSGEDALGNHITGFVFDNPNEIMPQTGGGCGGCPSNKGGGCSSGGCSTE